MRERIKVDGKKGTAVYLTKDFKPVKKEQAEMVKIIYDNGDIQFGTRRQ